MPKYSMYKRNVSPPMPTWYLIIIAILFIMGIMCL